MFRRSMGDADVMVLLTLDGQPVRARAGESLAAVLIAEGSGYCRTTGVSGAKRAPYCMMGACFDCLVIVNGVGNQQACMVMAKEGQVVQRQDGRREAGR
jgi:hypothetical protein